MSVLMAKLGLSVRDAIQGDVTWLIDELRHFAQFYGTKHSLMPEEEHARLLLSEWISRGPFFVAERDYIPAGFIAGVMHPHLYNPRLTVLTELFWWVSPEERGSRAGAFLFYEFEKYGREHADMIAMSRLANSPINEKVFTRRGYHLHESSYLLEVER